MNKIRQRHKLWNKEAKRPGLENKNLRERSHKRTLKMQRQIEELETDERVTEKDSTTEKEAQDSCKDAGKSKKEEKPRKKESGRGNW
jgi:hypothetical protein